VYCAGVNTFDAELRVAPVSEEEIDALPANVRDQLREMQAILRAALSRGLAGKRRGPGAEA
jgi:hypothetical protein